MQNHIYFDTLSIRDGIQVRPIFFYYFVCTSRWYIPNYSMAEELAWGRNAGCRFAHGSCGEWIDTQLLRCQTNYCSHNYFTYATLIPNILPYLSSGSTLAPFCNRLRGSPVRLGCTIDRNIISVCNLIDYGASPPLPEFQVI